MLNRLFLIEIYPLQCIGRVSSATYPCYFNMLAQTTSLNLFLLLLLAGSLAILIVFAVGFAMTLRRRSRSNDN